MWTLEQGLGDAFDADTRDAWAIAYEALASIMLAAADAEAAA
jgi:hemoglobin-like flavoprotein